MDKQLMKKLTSVSFIGAALLTYAVVNMLFKSMAGAFGPVQRLYSIDWLNHGLPILAAASVFLIMQLNPKILTWAEEVLLEVSKIVWPSRRDTLAMTVVVCVFVGIACFLLLIIDFVSHNVIRMIIN